MRKVLFSDLCQLVVFGMQVLRYERSVLYLVPWLEFVLSGTGNGT